MSEQTEQLQQMVEGLRDRVRMLERLVDETAERQALHGRPRYMIWVELLEELPAGGTADVQLIYRAATSASGGDGYEWRDKWIMEDVLATPLMPGGTCIPAETDEDPTKVCVAWFPLDEEYYVVGAETCPTTECSSGSSSS